MLVEGFIPRKSVSHFFVPKNIQVFEGFYLTITQAFITCHHIISKHSFSNEQNPDFRCHSKSKLFNCSNIWISNASWLVWNLNHSINQTALHQMNPGLHVRYSDPQCTRFLRGHFTWSSDSRSSLRILSASSRISLFLWSSSGSSSIIFESSVTPPPSTTAADLSFKDCGISLPEKSDNYRLFWCVGLFCYGIKQARLAPAGV